MLRQSGLEHFYPSFSTRGITQLDNLVQLSMQDYNSLGVTSMEDRRKLFQLIQTIKAEYPDISGAASAPVPTIPISHTSSVGGMGGIGSMATTMGGMGGMTSMAGIGGINTMDGSGYGMPGISRGYSAHGLGEMTPKPFDPRGSMGRRSGSIPSAALNHAPTGHSRSLSNSNISISSGMQQQQSLQQDDQFQQFQQQQQQLQQLQQQQYQQQQFMQQQYQQQIQQQQLQQQQQQQFDLRNFKEASEEEDEPLPVVESKQRGLDSWAAPSASRTKSIGRSAGANLASDLTAKIRVCVRKRPLNSKEINRGEKDMASVTGRLLVVDEPKVRVDMTKYIERHNFVFDEVFDSDASNEDVYKRTAYPLVQYLFEGGKATCFAYGQTGSGKTYTMLDDKQGLYVLAARDIFVTLRKPEYAHLAAHIGFYEIYQGQLYDLLNNRKKLQAREDGKNNVVITGLKEYEIMNVQGLMQVFEYGNNARSTGSTNANADSSRSHAIMQVVLRDRASRNMEGKLSFIDLAGSERGADRGDANTKTRMEGAEINKSLLALKECIRALDQGGKHTPFRQSKLTQVLKDSFVGNSRTCMVATVSPNNSNSEHTLNTLRYADRVKELKADKGGAVQGQDTGIGEDYMDDVEGYGEDDLGGNMYDDEYFSSDGENVADVTVDLLEDEEFPDFLVQEEMPHALAMNSFEHGHVLDEPGLGKSGTQQLLQQEQQQSPLLQRATVQQPVQPQAQQQQQPILEPERKKATPSKTPKGVFSRLPMPKSFQQSSSATPSGIPTLHHRLSQSGSSGRNNSSNNATSNNSNSPPSSKGRDPKISPPENTVNSGTANDYVSQKGSNSNSATATRPSINTRHSHTASASSASNANGPTSAGTGSIDPNNVMMDSPTSPKVAVPSTPSSANQGSSNSSSNGNGKTWSSSEMEEFLQEHRNQLKECGELTKRETKLLANISLSMSPLVTAQTGGTANTSESFLEYLEELDEIIDEKLITIVTMSHKLKALRGLK
ncbi:Kinesin-like protein kif24 [Mortierella sp. GBA43]|nr:Kinesin-like protein kif24 [Mortierella sp. GBA43]